MAIVQGPRNQVTEIRFAPSDRVKLTSEETEEIYNAASAIGGKYQYFEMVPGGGVSGIIYRVPEGANLEELENWGDLHPELQVTFRTNRPAPANAVYPTIRTPKMLPAPGPRPNIPITATTQPAETVTYINVGTPLEKRLVKPQSPSIPRVLDLPQYAGTPVKEEMQNPLSPTYGTDEPKLDEKISAIREYKDPEYTTPRTFSEQFGVSLSAAEAKKRVKAFGRDAPYPEWIWKSATHLDKVRNPYLTYLPKKDPAERVNDVRAGLTFAALVGKPTAEAAQRSGLKIWRLPKSYLGEYSGEENRYIVYRPGDTAKRDQVLKILEAYPVGYRGREYFQEMGDAMGVPQQLTTDFVNTFYKNSTTLPDDSMKQLPMSSKRNDNIKWLGLLAVVGIAVIITVSITKGKTTPAREAS
jgi:hypothetical protein